MKTILTFLFLCCAFVTLAAPPPPLVRNTYTTNYCTDLLINCRGIVSANVNTSIVVNSQWNTIDNANLGAVISGGLFNSIAGPASDVCVIGGGTLNVIAAGSDTSVIAGGAGNNINGNDTDCVISGGFLNLIDVGVYNTIAGGTENAINIGRYSVIGGGKLNAITVDSPADNAATIGGGTLNIANSNYVTISGGLENFILGLAGTIGGGGHNTIEHDADHGTISGGSLNSITNGSYCSIGGGSTNSITNGYASVIAGGYDNHMDSDYSVISGGWSNKIWGVDQGTKSSYSVIGGGLFNEIRPIRSVIGGGDGNYIGDVLNGRTVISGGYWNYSLGNFSTIIGGRENTNASGDYSTILGGYSNRTEGAVSVAGGRSACAMQDGAWMFKDNSAGARSNNVANTFETYFTGAGAEGASVKLGVRDVWMTGTNRSILGTRSDGVVTPIIGLFGDTNRLRSSGANFGVLFNNSSDQFLTRMDNNGNWGFGTNVPQAKIHILGTATNVAVLRFANCDTNAPVTPGTFVRHLAIILDDGTKYWIPLQR